MADANVTQLAIVIPSQEINPPAGGGKASQVAVVALCGEAPPVAGGSTVSQVSIVVINYEYSAPIVPVSNMIRSIWGFPLLIQ